MSVQEMFDSVRALLEQHNSVVGEGKPGFVPIDEFIGAIKAAGGTTPERLYDVKYEDLIALLPESTQVKQPPIFLIKDIAKIFRSGVQKSENTTESVVTSKKAEKMSLRQLVENYDPEDATNPVGKRLAEISKGEPFLVYSEGRNVDVGTSYKLLKEIKDGFEGREHVEVNGEIKEIYAVGELPDHFLEENPLYRGRPLRPDGTCDQTGRSWAGVDMSIRQFIRIAMDLNELFDVSIDKAHDILDIAVGDDALNKLKRRYRKTAIEFEKQKKTGELPLLKLVFGREEVSDSSRPFDKAKKVEWTSEWGNTITLGSANTFTNFGLPKKVWATPKWKKGK